MERLWNAYGAQAKTEFLLCWEHMEHMEHLIFNKLHAQRVTWVTDRGRKHCRDFFRCQCSGVPCVPVLHIPRGCASLSKLTAKKKRSTMGPLSAKDAAAFRTGVAVHLALFQDDSRPHRETYETLETQSDDQIRRLRRLLQRDWQLINGCSVVNCKTRAYRHFAAASSSKLW